MEQREDIERKVGRGIFAYSSGLTEFCEDEKTVLFLYLST